MNKRRTNLAAIMVFVAILVLVFSLLVTCTKPTPPAKEKVLKIGMFYELTGPVQSSMPGITLAHYDAYWKWLNETKGGIRGVKVEHMWYDGAFNVERSVAGYKQFKDAGVVLVEPWTSVTGEPLLEIAARDGIPMASHWATDKALDPKYWMYSWSPTFTQFFTTTLKWIKESDWKESRPPRVAQIGWKIPMGISHVEPSKPYAAQLGIELGPFEYVPLMPLDSTAELLRIKEAGADYIYMPMTGAAPGLIFRDAKKLGLLDKFKWIMGPMVMKSGSVPLMGDITEGMYGITYDSYPQESIAGVPFANEYLERYLAKDPKLGRVPYDSAYMNLVVDQLIYTEVLGRAIDKVGYENLNGKAVKEALDTLKDFDTMGLTAPITFGPTQRQGQNKSRMGKIVWKGPEGIPAIVPITNWIEPPEGFRTIK